MYRIKNILDTLRKNEISIIEKYISFSSRSEKKNSLLHLINDYGIIDENVLAIHLYNKPTNNIKKLKERLLSDIEDVIFMRFGKPGSAGTYRHTESEIMSSLVLASYYLQNGLLSEANIKLRKVGRLFKTHESILLEVVYRQLYCNYLERTSDKSLNDELYKLFELLKENTFLTELKIIGNNRLPTSERVKINQFDENADYEVKRRFYTTSFEKLTQIKYLITRNEIAIADEKLKSLFDSLILKKDVIPPELIIDSLIQNVKINFLKNDFTSNEKLLKRIKEIPFSSESLMHEYLVVKFTNHFKLKQYEKCMNVIKYFNTDFSLRKSTNRDIYCHWQYFNICMLFMKNEFSKVYKLIALFPGKSNLNHNIFLNVKIIELYALVIQDKFETALHRLASLKQSLKNYSINNQKRYSYLINRLVTICDASKSQTINYHEIPAEDILNSELIPFEYIETRVKLKTPKHQYTY